MPVHEPVRLFVSILLISTVQKGREHPLQPRRLFFTKTTLRTRTPRTRLPGACPPDARLSLHRLFEIQPWPGQDLHPFGAFARSLRNSDAPGPDVGCCPGRGLALRPRRSSARHQLPFVRHAWSHGVRRALERFQAAATAACSVLGRIVSPRGRFLSRRVGSLSFYPRGISRCKCLRGKASSRPLELELGIAWN